MRDKSSVTSRWSKKPWFYCYQEVWLEQRPRRVLLPWRGVCVRVCVRVCVCVCLCFCVCMCFTGWCRAGKNFGHPSEEVCFGIFLVVRLRVWCELDDCKNLRMCVFVGWCGRVSVWPSVWWCVREMAKHHSPSIDVYVLRVNILTKELHPTLRPRWLVPYCCKNQFTSFATDYLSVYRALLQKTISAYWLSTFAKNTNFAKDIYHFCKKHLPLLQHTIYSFAGPLCKRQFIDTLYLRTRPHSQYNTILSSPLGWHIIYIYIYIYIRDATGWRRLVWGGYD